MSYPERDPSDAMSELFIDSGVDDRDDSFLRKVASAPAVSAHPTILVGTIVAGRFRVDRGWAVTLYEHANFTGRTMVVTADSPFVGAFNDLTSAIVVSRQ